MKARFTIKVINQDNESLAKAKVTVTYLGSQKLKKGETTPLVQYIKDEDVFEIINILNDKYRFDITCNGYDNAYIIRFGHTAGWRETVCLEAPGVNWFPIGTARFIPPSTDTIALRVSQIDRISITETRNELEVLTGSKGVNIEGWKNEDFVCYKMPSRFSKAKRTQFNDRVQKTNGIDHAGLVVYIYGNNPVILTKNVFVTLIEDVSVEQYLSKINPQIWTGKYGSFPGTVYLTYLPELNSSFYVAMRDLDLDEDVKLVEPDAISEKKLFAVNPTNFLYQYQWYNSYIDLPNAWERLQGLRDANGNTNTLTFGSADTIISIYDTGVASAGPINNAAPTNPNFIGTVNGGLYTAAVGNNNKVYRFLDCNNLQLNNNNINLLTDDHGTGCAGVASALANHADGFPGAQGIAGVAGNSRLMGVFWNNAGGNGVEIETFQWIAGLPVNWTMANYAVGAAPPVLNLNTPGNPPADVLSNSWGGGAIAAPAQVNQMVHQVSHKGRNGRGALILFAASNSDQVMWNPGAGITDQYYGYNEPVLAIAACSLASNGEEERSPFSSYGNTIQINNLLAGNRIDNGIDVCAPSHHHYMTDVAASGYIDHHPPFNYGSLSADLLTQGNLPFAQTAVTTLDGAVAINANSLRLANTAGFAANMAVIVGAGNAVTAEGHRIAAPAANRWANLNNYFVAGSLVRRNVFERAHANGVQVIGGLAHNKDDFGGTSSACPTTAGIVALILSAKPTLTGAEARDILRRSSMPIDMRLGAVAGVNLGWRDNANNPIVDANNQLIFAAPLVQTTISAAVNAAPAGAISSTIQVNSVAGFIVGQAILIGAETTLSANTVSGSPTISVVRANDFIGSRKVHINDAPKTHMASPHNAAFVAAMGAPIWAQAIMVGNTKGFVNNQVIRIGGANPEVATINNVFNSTVLVLNAPLALTHNEYDEVTLNNIRDRTLTAGGVNAGANTLTFGTNVGSVYTIAPTAVRITQENTEIRIIRSIDTVNNRLIVDALRHNQVVGTRVTAGRVPYYSDGLGFGRVDAKLAVDTAIDYNHNGRDLMVKDYIGDTGLGTPNNVLIDSPDIWVANAAGIVPPVPNTWVGVAPNVKPARGAARWINVRYADRGDGNFLTANTWATRFAFPPLDYAVNVYLCIKDRTIPITRADYQQTLVPAGVNVWTNYSVFTNSNIQGTQLIGSYASAFTGAQVTPVVAGIANFQIQNIIWPQNVIPNLSVLPANFQTYLLFEVTPHDGALADDDVRKNNNISYKTVNFFHDVEYKDGANVNALKQSISMDPGGATVTENFRINIKDSTSFPLANITVTITRHNTSAPNDVFTYALVAGNWTLTGGPAGGWLVINPPLDGITNAAPAAAPTDIYFTGSVTVNNTSNKIEFSVSVPDSYPNPGGGAAIPFTTIKVHEIILFTALPYNETFSVVPSGKPRLHVFTDMNLLNKQTAADAFGPDNADPNNRFRITSSFTTLAPVVTLPAYAVVSGYVFIQRDAADANKVNLFLKPLRQSRIGFTSVKYFVYRGLTLTDFLQGPGAVDELLARPAAGASDFMQYVHQVYNQRAVHAGVAAAPMPSRILGWNPAGQNAADPLDKFFFTSNSDNQLPIATLGQQLGTFYIAGASKIGFEIILEEGVYQPTLGGYARLSEYVIGNNPVLPAAPLANRAAREEILNFIDPAAYYGMHYFLGVETQSNPNPVKKELDLYTVAVEKYATSNKRYLDVRNENGYSYNYYQNYTNLAVGAANGNIQVSGDPNALNTIAYGTNGWPIQILDESQYLTTDETTRLAFTLKVNDNIRPLLYAASGELTSASTKGDRFIDAATLLPVAGANWTSTIQFESPNVMHPTNSPNRIPVAELIKVLYNRRPVTNQIPALGASVVPTRSYLDNAFGPIDLPELFQKNNDDIEWINAQDQKFIDNNQPAPDNFAFMAERGVAHEQNRVIFYAAARDYLDKKTTKKANLNNGLTTGISSRGNFFEVAHIFQGLNIKIKNINPADPPISGANWTPTKLVTFEAKGGVIPESMLLLGISEAEYAALQAIAGFDPSHQRNVVMEEIFMPNGNKLRDKHLKIYRAFKLKVSGWDAAGNALEASPANDIFVFTQDGFIFNSRVFGDLQPIPPQYTPTAEENRTELKASEVNTLISADPNMVTAVNNFAAAVASVTNDADAKVNLEALAVNSGTDLWNDSVTFVKNTTSRDSRPLYWARLKMLILLKKHPFCLANPAEGETLAKIFEDHSRGYETIPDFSGAPVGAKKILVFGYDPFQLDLNLNTENPSGSAALFLDKATIAGGGGTCYVRTAVFPVRYDDFDANIVETLVTPFITGNLVNAIISISQNGGLKYYDIERIASRYRGGSEDNNNDKRSSGPVGTGNAYAEFYETNLPVIQMVPGPFPGNNTQTLYFDQSYRSTTTTVNEPYGVSGAANSNAPAYPFAGITGKARDGSGGDYLSNEIFYRIAHVRNANAGTTVKTGHFHIPAPSVGVTMDNVVQATQNTIQNGTPGY